MRNKNKKKLHHSWHKHIPLKALIAFTLMLGGIIAGLLILSYQPQPEISTDTAIETIVRSPEGKAPAKQKPTADRSKPKTTVILSPETTVTAEQNRIQTPRLAIIMDDLGASVDKAMQVANLDIPVAMSIIPNLRHARETMYLATEHAREVMVHLPMEPLNYPRYDPGARALMLNMSDAEIKSRTVYFLRMLPHATGCNNHMGSAFTQHSHQMSVALKMIAERGLFFVDSLTSAASVGAQVASAMHVPTVTRDVFLDNDRDVSKITIQLYKLIKLAQKNGSAIGICHPYPETITALRNLSSMANESGVTVVNVAKLVH